MIIDFHAHIFPEKIRERAIQSLKDNSGIPLSYSDGSLDSLLAQSQKCNIDYSVVLNIATNPHQQTNVNDFAIEMNNIGGIISFGSVNPFSENVLEELVRIKNAGLKGVKLHPDYQGFFVDDEMLFPIYKKIGELGLITVFHAGIDIGLYDPVHCPPQKLAKVLHIFGGSPVVAAHFGGFEMWYDVEKYLVGRDIYFDTAYCFSRMPYLHARKIMEMHGADRILFGTDSPWSDIQNEINFVKSFASGNDLDKILGLNAKKILGIK